MQQDQKPARLETLLVLFGLLLPAVAHPLLLLHHVIKLLGGLDTRTQGGSDTAMWGQVPRGSTVRRRSSVNMI